MPTAVLSNQTGFDSYAVTDLTEQMSAAMGEWEKLGARFDAVTTGFLMNARQAGLARAFAGRAKADGALILVDPVLGDGGGMYPIFGGDMLEAMRLLVQGADVITPNLTEACLLTNTPYVIEFDDEIIWNLARELSELGPRTVVITGVPSGDKIRNIAYLSDQNQQFSVPNRKTGGGYSGTGDILAAIICGSLLRGDDVETALRTAGALLEKAIAATFQAGTDPREGVAFEPFLSTLLRETK